MYRQQFVETILKLADFRGRNEKKNSAGYYGLD